MHLSTPFLLALAGSACALPSTPHVVHEKRSSLGCDWARTGNAPADTVLPMRIALKQQNIDQIPQLLDDVSNPTSKNFGKHWTGEELARKFAPSHKTIAAVKSWLNEAGYECAVSANRGWIEFNSTIGRAEELLRTRYHVYRRDGGGREHIGCDGYSIPKHVQEHVDFVTPTVALNELKRSNVDRRQDSDAGVAGRRTMFHAVDDSVISSLHSQSGSPATSGSNAKFGNILAAGPFLNTTQRAPSVASCAQGVTPACIRAMYNIPAGNSSTPGNELGLYETLDYYDQADLDDFFTRFAPSISNGTAPTLDSINGGLGPSAPGTRVSGETVLDLQVIHPLIHPQGVRLLSTDDPTTRAQGELGHLDSLLDALDASFCTFLGGDDPSLDYTYPGNGTGAYNGTKMCGSYTAPSVLSISYGYAEAYFPPAYLTRQCLEFGKLGLAGTTVVTSSGDSGVSAPYCANPQIRVATPQFPASCPFVTAVGGTMLNANVSELTDPQAEVAARKSGGYQTGGGFSSVFAMPEYQRAAVERYLDKYAGALGNGSMVRDVQYNSSGRAYPDVAAIGTNVTTITNGKVFNADGTSASAPLFASLITLINELRAQGGKGPLGFINPTLYANKEVFKDITSGNNGGCGLSGFTALEGWDPVTGFGTPQWEPLKDLLLNV